MGWCRNQVNQSINIVRRLFKWAVENELIPGSIHHALQAVSPLKAGRSAAKEPEPVKPVPDPLVYAISAPCLAPGESDDQLAAIDRHAPRRVVIMRGIDIDTTGRLWLYRPSRHKTAHRGHDRVIFLGPQGQKIVQEFLKPDTTAYLFPPADAQAERRALATR